MNQLSGVPPMVHSAKSVATNIKDKTLASEWRKNNDEVRKLKTFSDFLLVYIPRSVFSEAKNAKFGPKWG